MLPKKRKEDIRIVLHDICTEKDRDMGFSIKSKLGGRSSLFNSNKDGTNLKFKLDLQSVENKDEYIKSLNDMSNTKEKRRDGFTKKWFDSFIKNKVTISYDSVVNKIFKYNLSFIDSEFDKIIAECLIVYYAHNDGNKVSEITKKVAKKDPCKKANSWYEYKMKQFLLTVALGMTANTNWNCKYAANGGYIVVKENGEIICYHFYDREQLENYLFYNTAFDTPSTFRHLMYKIDDDGTLKLNIQIRFIHREFKNETNSRK